MPSTFPCPHSLVVQWMVISSKATSISHTAVTSSPQAERPTLILGKINSSLNTSSCNCSPQVNIKWTTNVSVLNIKLYNNSMKSNNHFSVTTVICCWPMDVDSVRDTRLIQRRSVWAVIYNQQSQLSGQYSNHPSALCISDNTTGQRWPTIFSNNFTISKVIHPWPFI